jgi:signal transduction histidine kinase
MNREDALALLQSTNPRERLEAARFLERVATPGDSEAIRAARHAESVVWIRDALTRALHLAGAGGAAYQEPATPAAGDAEAELDAVYSAAIRDIADQLVHELAPLVGAARLHAAEELGDHPDSKTRRDLERISAVLKAIDEFARASAAPIMQEINIADLASAAVATIGRDCPVEVQVAGSDPFPALGDPALILIALRNGLANAVDATESVDSALREPVVVSWGRTGRDYRISILDRGPGLPADVETLLDLGVTTKDEEHSGLGLTLARRAALSLRGTLSLKDVDPKGVLFELRWPREA